MLISSRFFLTRTNMIDFLADLETADDDTAVSLYLPPGISAPEVWDSLEKAFDHHAIPPELAELAADSGTGTVVFWGSTRKYLVSPPFPLDAEHLSRGFNVTTLRALLQRDFRVALILVRLGAYAIGLGQGENLITSKVGTGLVHGRHKKGGSSQQRFQRHREKQIEYFLDRVCHRVQERLKPHARTLDYMVYGGARTTILSLQKRCPFLHQFDSRTLPPLLDIPQPRQAVLEASIQRVWSSCLMEWHSEEAPG